MLTVVPILLTILLSAADLVTVAVDDLAKAPRIAPLPEGLPRARLAPDHGRWMDVDGVFGESGTYLPSPLDREYYRRLRACERLPDAFQVQLDGLRARCQTDCEGRVKTTEARCIAQRLKDEAVTVAGWKDWQVGLLMTAAAIVAGSAVAIIAKGTQ